jgi:hypothetical protein
VYVCICVQQCVLAHMYKQVIVCGFSADVSLYQYGSNDGHLN